MLDGDDRRGLFANVAVSVGIAALANGVLAAFGLLRSPSEIWPAFAPPGHTIGAIWVGLFAAMGAARWHVVRRRDAVSPVNARAIVVLIALCLAYPFYTHAVGGHPIELAGNVVTFGVAVWIAVRIRRSVLPTALVSSVAAWVAFATVLVAELVRLNGWST